MNNNNLNNQQMMNQQFGGQVPNNNLYNQNNINQPSMNNQIPQNQSMQQVNQQLNKQQMMNQQFGGQVPNNNQYNQNNFNQQPINNQFNSQPNFNNNLNSNKSKTKLFIIIGAIVLGIAILAIVLVLVLGNNKKDNKYDNENHYEEDNINNPTNETVDQNNYISYKGFDFEKKSGYQYSIDADGLTISNNNYATMIQIISGSYQQVKSQSDVLIQKYRNSGIDVQNYKVANYDNKEVMTFEISEGSQKMIMYITEANANNVILGMAMNSRFLIDYSDINTTVSLIKNLKYSGNYKAPADENMVMEFKNLFE